MAKADRAPKKIAGLKLPKSVRQAPAIRSLLATAAGRKILGDALIEGAATAAARVLEAHEAAKAIKAAAPQSNGALKRVKTSKPAPGAAPTDDLKVAAPQSLMPLDEKPERDLIDPPKPSAAD